MSVPGDGVAAQLWTPPAPVYGEPAQVQGLVDLLFRQPDLSSYAGEAWRLSRFLKQGTNCTIRDFWWGLLICSAFGCYPELHTRPTLPYTELQAHVRAPLDTFAPDWESQRERMAQLQEKFVPLGTCCECVVLFILWSISKLTSAVRGPGLGPVLPLSEEGWK